MQLLQFFVAKDHAVHHKSSGRNLLEDPAVLEAACKFYQRMDSQAEVEPARRGEGA